MAVPTTREPEVQMQSTVLDAARRVQQAAESEPRFVVVALVTLCIATLLTFASMVIGVFGVTGRLDTATMVLLGMPLVLNLVITLAIAWRLLGRPWNMAKEAIKELLHLAEASLPWPATQISADTPIEDHLSGIAETTTLSMSSKRLSSAVCRFALHLPDQWVRHIIRGNPDATAPLSLKPCEVTTMFVDIANYTSLCESLSQADLQRVLAAYFDRAIWIIHNFQGTVAEILGDGILAFWNVPGDVEDFCGKACLAAIAQQESMQSLNRSLVSESLPEMQIRIGVNTGQAYAGNIGSAQRMKFGCVGDSVNTAARLEGLCKVFDVRIILSESTRVRLPQWGFLLRPLGKVRLKGKYAVTTVHELMEPKEPERMPLRVRPASPLSTMMHSQSGSMLPLDRAQEAAEAYSVKMADSGGARKERSDARKASLLASRQQKLQDVDAADAAQSEEESAEESEREGFLVNSNRQSALCAQYTLALKSFEEAKFAQAVNIVEKRILAQWPQGSHKTSCDALLQRARAQMEEGPFSDKELSGWQGVLNLETK